MMRCKIGLLVVAGLLVSLAALSQKSYQVGLGPTRLLDTYLSQEKYSGTGLTFLTTSENAKPASRWSWLWQHQLNLSTNEDRAKNGTELEGGYNLYLGRYYAWHLLDGDLTLQAGGLADLGLGFIYNTRNGNNPAQAKLDLMLDLSAACSYRFRLFHHPFALRYQLTVPFAGVAFSPNY